MFYSRRLPSLPKRDFPLVLRREWRCGCPARKGRLRALAFLATRREAARPATCGTREVAA